MTDETSTTAVVDFIPYSTWLTFADEITDYDIEMSEKMESAKRDYEAQRSIKNCDGLNCTNENSSLDKK